LGKVVFQNAGNRKNLESILHPRIRAVIFKRSQQLFKRGHRIVAIEAPLLFETGFNRFLDQTWVIWARETIAADRIEKRDGRSLQEIHRIFKAQLEISQKIKLADRSFSNNASKDALAEKIERALLKILQS
jgi:dephospho-CoA kinase